MRCRRASMAATAQTLQPIADIAAGIAAIRRRVG
jgi:hypothetical protein